MIDITDTDTIFLLVLHFLPSLIGIIFCIINIWKGDADALSNFMMFTVCCVFFGLAFTVLFTVGLIMDFFIKLPYFIINVRNYLVKLLNPNKPNA